MAALVAALLAATPAVAEPGETQSEPARAAVDPEAACAQAVAARVQAHYDSVRDFAADFEQTTHSAGFASALPDAAAPSRGEMVLAKPGKMRWTYTDPEPHLVVSDGVTLWLYSPQLAEAQRLPVTEGYLHGAALEFLLGDGRLLDSFRVSASRCVDQPQVELDLEPRDPASYERLGLTVRAESGEVVATGIVDLFGNRTRISFGRVRRNQDPPPETFRFEPGPEVEVIDVGGS